MQLEFILKLKIKRKRPITAFYSEFETVLNFITSGPGFSLLE